MSAGKPDFKKLYQMGKLPENQRHQIPWLVEKDKKVKSENKQPDKNNQTGNPDINKKIQDPVGNVDSNCAYQGCEYVAKGSLAQQQNRMKLHLKSHNKVKNTYA